MSRNGKSALAAAAEGLRAISLDSEEGSFIGTEETLLTALGASRSTVRQAARLVEREGLLRTKRGLNGGYFASRADAATIEMAVSSYLQTLDMDARDVTRVASSLWMLVVHKAAENCNEETKAVVAGLMERVEALTPESSFAEVRDIERQSHRDMLRLSNSQYIQLIFDINIAFSRRAFVPNSELDGSPAHREFVMAWRTAKMLELSAIAQGNTGLAPLAAQQTRRIWHERIWASLPPI